ncbi:MAG TPA: 4-hydroxy-tetrahydrodipicolinate synthase [Gammaproteobacteria bacterium]|nr:4-hydroxy-tetrahydrodipicolinate synthase [Gammaproteobacteria bacterium]
MFQGSMVALVTPMTASGEIDEAALERLVEFHIENGTDALVPAGTTGESPTLRTPEHAEYLRTVVRLVRGRVPVLAGTGSNSTTQTLELSREAAQAGVDGCLLVVPYYNRPPQEGLYQHFRAIAEAVPLPMVLYNVPSRTACDLLPETVERLARISNIVGIKEATGDLARVQDLRSRCGKEFGLYSGDDATAMEFVLAGGDGTVSVTANVAPRLMHEMMAAARAGDREQAEALDAKLRPLHKALFAQTNPIPVKWALAEMGLIGGEVRLPLVPLAGSHQPAVRAALQEAGCL